MKECDAGNYLNRELSWLEFNQRVLDEALDPSTPLLERIKFFCITSSNLDEFFEVRVAGIKQQIESEVVERNVDGLLPSDCFMAIARRTRQLVAQQYACWREQLVPDLAKNRIRFLSCAELDGPTARWVDHFYRAEVRPVLTPLAIDPAHPFPQLLNKSLNLMVRLEMPRTKGGQPIRHLAVVQVPRILPRLIRLPVDHGGRDYLFLGQLIGNHLADLFPGATILGHWLFRVTRNSELYIDEEETSNLLKAVEEEVHNRRKGDAVRLEIEAHCPEDICQALLGTLHLGQDDLYRIDGPLNPGGIMVISDGDHSPELRDAPFIPAVPAALRDEPDIFRAIRRQDILMHHPYESFTPVVEFLEKAATDPAVLAIKQTLYRTGGDPRINGALMNAVRNGKQVTVVVELRARFDEAKNIEWARHLEQAGVHVVYGLVGYKIHAKITLVVRRDEDRIRRYVHLATGNYNPSTARLYTDLGLLTCRPEFGEDATNLFNLLTGICQFQRKQKFLVAPFDLHERLLGLIDQEIANARKDLPARIIARMNSLVDPDVIDRLYQASQAGVEIDLIVRGICCLRPGVPGLSENIRVRSIVDRFLEHSRIAYFENACQPVVLLASADWMPRNFFRRIELAIPIEDGLLRDRIINEILAISLSDNVKARILQPDGTYSLPARKPGEKEHRSQKEFMDLATGRLPDGQPRPGSKYPKVKLRTTPPSEKGRSKKPRPSAAR